MRCSATSRRRPAVATAKPVSRHLVEDRTWSRSSRKWEWWMQQTRTLIFTVFASIVVTASGPHAGSAQDASSPGGYQLFVTPYLWLAGTHATALDSAANDS